MVLSVSVRSDAGDIDTDVTGAAHMHKGVD